MAIPNEGNRSNKYAESAKMLGTAETCHQAEKPSLNVVGCGIPSIPGLPSTPTASIVRRDGMSCDDDTSDRFNIAKSILKSMFLVLSRLGKVDAFGLDDRSSIPFSFRHYAHNEPFYLGLSDYSVETTHASI
jgi:hypothetical protein